MIFAIEHDRCNEFDKFEYYWCADMLQSELSLAVEAAQEEYTAHVKELKNTLEPKHDPKYFNPLLAEDDTTIGELKRWKNEYEKKLEEYKKSNKKNFNDFLKSRGIIPIIEWIQSCKELPTVFLPWGHLHGFNLEY
jgi:hypothetical protein